LDQDRAVQVKLLQVVLGQICLLFLLFMLLPAEQAEPDKQPLLLQTRLELLVEIKQELLHPLMPALLQPLQVVLAEQLLELLRLLELQAIPQLVAELVVGLEHIELLRLEWLEPLVDRTAVVVVVALRRITLLHLVLAVLAEMAQSILLLTANHEYHHK
jgi:hypothetical protein